MAFCNIDDINLEILTWIIDFKLFINLSILDKKSYILITDTLIYTELGTLRNYNIKSSAKLKLKLNGVCMIDIYYKLGLINILKKLKKNNKYIISEIV